MAMAVQRGVAERGVCPWALSDDVPAAPQRSSRAGSARRPPRGDESETASTRSKMHQRVQSTCPWAADVEACEARHGGGTPSGRLAAVARQRSAPPLKDQKSSTMLPNDGDQHVSAPAHPSHGDGAESDDEEASQEEQRMLINQCMEKGLGEEEIMDMLERYHADKMVKKQRARVEQQQQQQRQQQQQQQQRRPPRDTPTSGSSSKSSVANQRMARASRENSLPPLAGLSNAEVTGLLHQNADTNLAAPLSLAQKRAKAREFSGAVVGGFAAEGSRGAYMESHQQAAASKSRNRAGSGIF
eukprot:TRINITY_DN3625_c1_g1_i1.p1 TRINITY_DN3625_c1_g1~~TRINITY_DN3625_c1_g1_i1.p1  ORF type:complete len:300 (+),score=60.58 TRINITY_DN3625_c1_g1_i1:87-986(+)